MLVLAVVVPALPPSALADSAKLREPDRSSAAVCGFWENAISAYYEHCNAPRRILIRVDYSGGGEENDRCRLVSARRTYLGSDDEIDNAYYISSGICPV
ncbi:DUF6355 family natural product biosynthesis protein [Streptosporangium carneum]|uniref:Uncharacterized protein n=1 Tax=Streptosporangium carneum TaxID=47481 RepID=A0A9W6HX35_9ACTN|nr:DUF6355 family natural product biosynthesis protein [Streptosporangium carneum]GLK07608.1 hypothetical protein GCM10017600_10130 [Streptosporangium carneum]